MTPTPTSSIGKDFTPVQKNRLRNLLGLAPGDTARTKIQPGLEGEVTRITFRIGSICAELSWFDEGRYQSESFELCQVERVTPEHQEDPISLNHQDS